MTRAQRSGWRTRASRTPRHESSLSGHRTRTRDFVKDVKSDREGRSVRVRARRPLVLQLVVLATLVLAAAPRLLLAQEGEEGGGHGAAIELLWIPIILLAAKLTGALAERFRQPAVVGELASGIILGNLALVGIGFFSPVPDNGVVRFLAELGVILLLFQIGLESSLSKMRTVGARALAVALIGVALLFAG